MNEWHLERLPGDVRREAESAAQQAGIPLHRWLAQIIREQCAAEGIAPSRELLRNGVDASAANGTRPSAQALGGAPAKPAGNGAAAPSLTPEDPPAPPVEATPVAAAAPVAEVPPSSPIRVAIPAATVNRVERRRAAPAPAAPAPAVAAETPNPVAQQLAIVRRNELSPLGEARLFLKLMTEQMVSISDITAATGRSPDQVARTLRLLGLSDRLRELIDSGALTREQAFALLDARDPESLMSLAGGGNGARSRLT